MLTTPQSETDLSAAVAFFPNDVYAIVNVRFDGQVRVCSSPDDFEVSVTKQHGGAEYLFKDLTEPFNSMHVLQLLGPSASSDQSFIFASVRAGTAYLEGWLNSGEASRFAAEASADACGRTPDFHLSPDVAGEVDAPQPNKRRIVQASVIDWLY